MGRTYKYLMILTFILNFANIYSQSDNLTNNLISTWHDKAIHTLYLDKKLLESAANALSQYLGPLAYIILENLPYIISFLALFFIFRRFLNIIDENLRMKNVLSALMAAIATYFLWPFVIPILIVAFIIKVFRVGISKLERFKAKLSKINHKLARLFSKATSDINDFNKNTDIIMKKINKVDEMITHPQLKRLISSLRKDIKALKKIMYCLLEETENENLTLRTLSYCSSNFNNIYRNAKIKIGQLASICSNPVLLRGYGNNIFKPNKFTQKHLRELINTVQDLNMRLEREVHEEGQKIFRDFHGLLISAENISREEGREMERELNVIERDVEKIPLTHNDKEKTEKNIQNVEKEMRNIYNKDLSPLKILEIVNVMSKPVKEVYKDVEKLKKSPGGSQKSYSEVAREVKKLLKSASKAGAQGAAARSAPGAAIRFVPGAAIKGGNAPGAAVRLVPGAVIKGGGWGAAGTGAIRFVPGAAIKGGGAPVAAARGAPGAAGGGGRGAAGKG